MFVTTPWALILLMTLHESALGSSNTESESDYKKIYDLGYDKRAYTYSANKRPQYDFGIGKRSPDSNRQKMYSFGLGKRFTNDDVSNYQDFLEDQLLRDEYNKRIKPYEFGLGKRAAPAPYSFGLGKRPSSGQGKMYSFGLGKRDLTSEFSGISPRSQRYNFGIGKREVNDDLNDFLVSLDGGSDHNIYTRGSQRYNFGVGKREPSENINDYYLLPSGDGKSRYIFTRASQKYNFGLGKRLMSFDDDNVDDEVNSIYDFHQPSSDTTKRSRYEFGLGKRNAEDFVDAISLEDGLYRNTRAKQRYNFGLGKREVSKEDLQQLEEDVSPTSTSSSGDSRNAFEDNNLSQQHASNTRKREIPNENNNNQH